ncbi:3-hydroxyacyl-CoA dehydrogenase/enoyl-CoA hydratase family protein [Tenuibacillus multivorans]|uniref:3-hydroxyacyl-CoA dehydrogenase n=1 Tax=Tenuibacillus multivorans TaxID=237069 RepID=A0A1H0DBS0_9BACI|nr:3-hydroxyacyl-CoA dehydrogenase/enoyl-CoA hydratase family protein [Tenuibacillus multivorans]GEL76624.1 enoyl-CoA hydratase [Tenuibacillus multivorans]SDN67411.1 3-hydroxyacyl-CoA dehydrogenase [Tenuibacillus multivorans]
MNRKIKRAAVLGSGVMGSGIAAHLANVGIPTLMLDIVPRELTEAEKKKGLTLDDAVVRNRIAASNKEKLKKQNPSPITSKKSLDLIQVGNFDDHMEQLSDVDWIIEVVVENLDIKKKVFEQVEAHRKEGAIVSSNTSGISIEAMAEGRSEDFKKHFLGTHFFNPPRYLKLLEVIPNQETDPDVLAFMKRFGEDVLGKGVVEAKDTPNFIANRIGTYGLLVTVKEMLEGGYSIGEVDSVTGPMIGRPKSATFRTLDVVGLDTFIHVAKNVYDHVEGDEKEAFIVPDFMNKMNEKGWLGAKSGQGFFLKKKGKDGSVIYELNPETMEYEERQKLKTNATGMAKQEKGSKRKLRALINAKGDRGGDLIWNITKPTLIYSAELVGEIADDIKAIDEAMKWGFGWELGPFEMWDAIGVKSSVERMKEEGANVPTWVKEMLDQGFESFYKSENGKVYYYHNGEYVEKQVNPKEINLKLHKEVNGVIKKNAGASLIDLGDDVALLEFHSQSNALGLDTMQMINTALNEVNENYKGLVIGNQGKNFCVGANLGLMLMEAQDFNFMELDLVVKQFQQAMMNIKYNEKPVVSAPFGMTLGGGTEVCLPAHSIQASQEAYMGLVEVGVGLIPGGGGNKEFYLKQLSGLPEGVDFDLQKVTNDVFEKIAMAKVSTSAAEAIENGVLDAEQDAISVNGDHLIHDAKQKVIALHDGGFQPRKREKVPVVGEQGYATMLLGAKSLANGGYASEHDIKIADKLAFVLAGGRLKYGTLVDEQYLLDLEREAFLSLIGEAKTQQRMQHMLMKVKPLRN